MDPIKKTAHVITDVALLEELNASLPILKEGAQPRNGFWALASVENPDGDSDGDVIVVDGITSDLNPEKGRFLPLLPGHKRKLDNGMAPEVGRIESLQKTKANGHPALAMYFTFALDEAGNPIDALVKSYYDRYRLGISNAFSVGMEATAQPEKIAKGGFRYKATKLYEVSLVSIGANADAVGITRGQDEEDEMLRLVKAIAAKVEELKGDVVKALAPFEDRFDTLEAALVTKQNERPILPLAPSESITDGLRDLANRLETRMSKK